MRWHLIQWGSFQKKDVKVDDDTMVMRIGRIPVLRAFTRDNIVHLEWLSEEWRTWLELHESPEFQSLVDAATDKLAKSAAAQPKGKGKGPTSLIGSKRE